MLTNSSRLDENAKLVVAIKQGNIELLNKLYDSYAPALTGIITKMTTDNKLVENILQGSFIDAWKQIESFNPTYGSFFFWLLRITRKTAIEAIKMETKTNYGEINFVHSIFDKKSNTERAFDLLFYKGYSFEEAANILNTSVAAIKAGFKITIQQIKQPMLV